MKIPSNIKSLAALLCLAVASAGCANNQPVPLTSQAQHVLDDVDGILCFSQDGLDVTVQQT